MDYMLKEKRRPKVIKPADAPKRQGATDLRFARLMGAQKWAALPEAVKRRFGHSAAYVPVQCYRGHVIYTKMNLAGYVLAQGLRLMGAPLPLVRGNEGCGAVVTIALIGQDGAQLWCRQYGSADQGFAQVIQSQKRFAGPIGLEEHIKPFAMFGVGMTLRLHAVTDGLEFRSERHFLTLGNRRAYLPRWLTPGALTASHIDKGVDDEGCGQFEFGLTLKHGLFGQLLDQRILFKDEGDAL